MSLCQSFVLWSVLPKIVHMIRNQNYGAEGGEGHWQEREGQGNGTTVGLTGLSQTSEFAFHSSLRSQSLAHNGH